MGLTSSRISRKAFIESVGSASLGRLSSSQRRALKNATNPKIRKLASTLGKTHAYADVKAAREYLRKEKVLTSSASSYTAIKRASIRDAQSKTAAEAAAQKERGQRIIRADLTSEAPTPEQILREVKETDPIETELSRLEVHGRDERSRINQDRANRSRSQREELKRREQLDRAAHSKHHDEPLDLPIE